MKSSCFVSLLLLIFASSSGQQLGTNGISPIDELINAQKDKVDEVPVHKPVIQAAGIPTTHTVESGDNPWTIAKQYGVAMDELLAVNGIENSKGLQIGQTLKLPEPKILPAANLSANPIPETSFDPQGHEVYVIKNGDNPWTIAKRLKVDYEALIALNKISDPKDLKIGQKLMIPEKGEVVAPTISTPAIETEVPFDADGHDVYVIKNGDNPWTVARKLKIDYEAFLALNQIANPRDLKIGQKLKIPKKGEEVPKYTAPNQTPEPAFDAAGHDVYVIKRGDNPWDVARALKVDYQELIALNKIANPKDLKIGQKLKIPKKGS